MTPRRAKGSKRRAKRKAGAGLTDADRLFNLMSALADHVAGLSDKQVLADAKAMGVDIDASAKKLRAFLLKKAKDAIERKRLQRSGGLKRLQRLP